MLYGDCQRRCKAGTRYKQREKTQYSGRSCHLVVHGLRGAVYRKGQLKPISVVVKVRQGRRASTLVTGFEPFFLEGEEMADEFRRLCACATSGAYLVASPRFERLNISSVSCSRKRIWTGSVCTRETCQDRDGLSALEGDSEEVDRNG